MIIVLLTVICTPPGCVVAAKTPVPACWRKLQGTRNRSCKGMRLAREHPDAISIVARPGLGNYQILSSGDKWDSAATEACSFVVALRTFPSYNNLVITVLLRDKTEPYYIYIYIYTCQLPNGSHGYDGLMAREMVFKALAHHIKSSRTNV